MKETFDLVCIFSLTKLIKVINKEQKLKVYFLIFIDVMINSLPPLSRAGLDTTQCHEISTGMQSFHWFLLISKMNMKHEIVL